MPLFKIIFLCFLSLANYPVFALGADDLLPPSRPSRFPQKRIPLTKLKFPGTLPTVITFIAIKYTSSLKRTNPVRRSCIPAGKTKHDEFFGDVVIYRDDLKIPVSLTAETALLPYKFWFNIRAVPIKASVIRRKN